MAVAVADKQGTNNVSQGTTLDLTTLTVSGSNTGIIALISTTGVPTGVTVVWDPAGANQSLALIDSEADPSGSQVTVFAFLLIAPTAGNKTLRYTASGGGNQYVSIQAVALTGADQSTLITSADTLKNNGNSTTPTTGAVTSSSDGATFAATANNTVFVSSNNQTLIFSASTGGVGGSGTYALGGSTNTHSWTLSTNPNWACIGVHVIAFTAGSPPTLTTVSPNTGNHNTTVAVTLTGTNFVASGLAVSISGSNVAVTSVTYVSPTSVTCNFVIDITAAAGARNVSVTTVNGTSGNQTFTINTPPTISSISPIQVDVNTTNTTITVTGTGIATTGLAASISPSTDLTIHSVSFGSSTSMTFQVDVASIASPSFRTVTISQTVGGVSNGSTITIGHPAAGGGSGAVSSRGSGAIRG